MITPVQCKMARAAVGWSTRDLADRANVGATTVNRFEVEARTPIKATLMAIQRALESGGVEFLDGDGVRMRQDRGAAA